MKQLTFILVVLTIFSSCSLFDNDSPTPFFLDIPSVSVQTTSDQGEPTHKITDVWVNANGKSLGVFPLPARVPVIIDDLSEVEITIFPGIRNNGVKESAFIYKLMNPTQLTLTPKAGEIVTNKPVFQYTENSIFDFVESFESSNQFQYQGENNSTGGRLITTSDMAKYGQKAGKITVNDSIQRVEIGTIGTFSGAKADTYIELDYKNDIPFFVGLYKTTGGRTQQIYNVLIPPKSEWNKIYLDFTLNLAGTPADNYRAMILVSKSGTNAPQGNVYVDNVKLAHF